MAQAALPFDWPADEDDAAFLPSPANRAARDHLARWADWPVMATVLTGPRRSGRSLLGRAFARRAGGVLIDEAERADEEALFHAWNRAQQVRRPLLLVADAPAPSWGVRLPDLRSRLLATPHVAIEEPDDLLVHELLPKLLNQRGLLVPPEVVTFLAPRAERSYLALGRLVEALDRAALAGRRRLSVPLAREVLAGLGEGADAARP